MTAAGDTLAALRRDCDDLDADTRDALTWLAKNWLLIETLAGKFTPILQEGAHGSTVTIGASLSLEGLHRVADQVIGEPARFGALQDLPRWETGRDFGSVTVRFSHVEIPGQS